MTHRPTRQPDPTTDMPHPQLPGQPRQAPDLRPAPEDDPTLGAFARALPVAISLLFHVGLALIFVLLAFVAIRPNPPVEPVPIPTFATAHATLNPPVIRRNPVEKTNLTRRDRRNPQHPTRTPRQRVPEPVAQTPTERLAVATDGSRGAVGKGAQAAPGLFGLGGRGGGQAGGPLRAKYVVYLIDRSGSMIDSFDRVRLELMRSVGRLSDTQRFSVIFFNDGPCPLVNPAGQLVPATAANTISTAKFLETLTAMGQTDPLPAIEAAFDALDRAGPEGKVIYLLTDGLFPDSAAVARLVARRNAKVKARLFTLLYGRAAPVAAAHLQALAESHGGQFSEVGE